jgi:hypothetical protein
MSKSDEKTEKERFEATTMVMRMLVEPVAQASQHTYTQMRLCDSWARASLASWTAYGEIGSVSKSAGCLLSAAPHTETRCQDVRKAFEGSERYDQARTLPR